MLEKSKLKVRETYSPLDISDIRKQFPILSSQRGEKTLLYLDNAATTQKPLSVVEAVSNFYTNYNANTHRGIYDLADEATTLYEDARATVARFISAPKKENIIFTRNTTEGVSIVAHGWGEEHVKAGDEIMISILEHHSNILPWRMLAQKTGAKLIVIPITQNGIIDLTALQKKLSKKTKLVSITHVSNVLGTVQPIGSIVSLAKTVGAKVVVDGAQAIPHLPVDVSSLGIDAYAFSGHKVYGPTGIGALYLKEDFQKECTPINPGGGTVSEVTELGFAWREGPQKFEGGTPHIAGAIGLAAALRFVDEVGWECIEERERTLLKACLEKLSNLNVVRILGNSDMEMRGPIVSFTVEGIHPHDLASFLSEEGIAIRAGTHCAEPLHRALVISASARVSFGIYNTIEEIQRFVEAVSRAQQLFSH